MFDLPLRDMYTLEGKAIYIKELNQTIGRLHQTVGDAMKTMILKFDISGNKGV